MLPEGLNVIDPFTCGRNEKKLRAGNTVPNVEKVLDRYQSRRRLTGCVYASHHDQLCLLSKPLCCFLELWEITIQDAVEDGAFVVVHIYGDADLVDLGFP